MTAHKLSGWRRTAARAEKGMRGGSRALVSGSDMLRSRADVGASVANACAGPNRLTSLVTLVLRVFRGPRRSGGADGGADGA